MKHVFLAISASLLMVAVGYCQELKQPLQLTIKSDKQAYEVGEEIWIEGVLSNHFDKVTTIDPLNPGDATQSFKLFIITPGKSGYLFPWIGKEGEKLKEAWLIQTTREMKPQEDIKIFRLRLNDFSVYYTDEKSSETRPHPLSEFMQAGVYTISASLSQLGALIHCTSDPITVEVR